MCIGPPCRLWFYIARRLIDMQEQIDEEGCGPTIAAMRFLLPTNDN